MHAKTTLAAVLAASLLGLGAAAHAQVNAVITVGPPAPIVETVPAPRHGYAWAGGHYDWRHGQYVWVPGHWITARNGYEWRDPRWVQRPDGEWVMVGGSWERGRWEHEHDADYGPHGRYSDRGWNRHDSDGDGVPDRYDRHPDNPNRS